jgi:hypothetical protein
VAQALADESSQVASLSIGTMKFLTLNGSPRKHGVVATLLKCVADGAAEQGHEIEWIDVCMLDMRFCTACMRCRPDSECRLPEDDAHRIGRKIKQADGLIVGTPTHWGNMSAPLKVLFDRNVPAFMGECASGIPRPRRKGMPAAIVAACTTPWFVDILASQSAGAVRAVREVLGYGGYRILGAVVKPGTKTNTDLSERLRRKAMALGRKFSETTRMENST